MKNSLKSIIITIFLALFSACSGGSDSSTNTHLSSVNGIAYFIDSPVSGLQYTTQSIVGITDSDGAFEYAPSDINITFHAGEIVLGTIDIKDINSDSKLYVQDLAKVSRDNLSDTKMLKIATFLQSLDTKTNVMSITLNKNDLSKFTQKNNIDDVNLTKLLMIVGKVPKDRDSVVENLGNTMRVNGIAMYNYTPQVQDSNITTFVNTATNGVFHASDKNDNHLTYLIESNTSHGILKPVGNSGIFKYTPENGYIGSDNFTYKAYDGEKYSKVATVTIKVDQLQTNSTDTQPPLAPIIVSINAQESAMTLFWLGSIDETTSSDKIRYEIYLSQDSNFTADVSTLKQTLVNTLEADIDDLSPDTLYYVKIKAMDEAGNFSLSSESNITTSSIVPIIANNVKRAVDLHLDGAVIDTNKLIFNDSKKAKLPQIDDILIGTAGDAYLKKVIDINKSGDRTVITTSDAVITDVIDTATLSSETTLFNTSSSNTEQRSLKRSVAYKSNGTKENTLSWDSGRLSVTDVSDIKYKSSIKRSQTKSNNGFDVTIAKDKVTVAQNQSIRIDVEAIMKQVAKDDKWKFKTLKLVSFSHANKNVSGLFFKQSQLDENEAKAYISWTPTRENISTTPYIAKFEVFAEDSECSDLLDVCDSAKETIEAKITVIGDGKVDTGNDINTTFGKSTEFKSNVNYKFTPKLTIQHVVNATYIDYVRVSVLGKLDYQVLSTFKFNTKATKEYKKQLVNKSYKSVYMAGNIPIYQEIVFTLDVNLEAAAEGSIEAKSDLTINTEILAGIQYKEGKWIPLSSHKIDKNYDAIIKTAGGVVLKARFIPNIEIKFYKIASTGLSVEPWLEGNLKASASAMYNTDFVDQDVLGLYRVENCDLNVGIEGKVYADLSIWKLNLAHYPTTGDKKTIFNPTMYIFSIPKLELIHNSKVDICEKNPYLIDANITYNKSLIENKFVESSIKWLVFPSRGATITPNSSNKKEATFAFTKKDEYTVFMTGYSELLGSVYGKQYESFKVDTRNCIIPDVIAPEFTSSASVTASEGRTTALTLVASDDTTLSYSISGGDSAYFNINSATGVVTFKTAPVYDDKSVYTFTAKAVDEAANETTQIVTINIIKVSDSTSPVFKSKNSASVYENQLSAITLVATDDNSTVSYSISGGDSASFVVGYKNGVVKFLSEPDFETKFTYTFTAIATDEAGNEDKQDVTINILDVDEGEVSDLNGTYVGYYTTQTDENLNENCLPKGYSNDIVLIIDANYNINANVTIPSSATTNEDLNYVVGIMQSKKIVDTNSNDDIAWTGEIDPDVATNTHIVGYATDDNSCEYSFTVLKR